MRRWFAAFSWLSAIIIVGIVIGYFFWPQFVQLEELHREEKRLRMRVEVGQKKNQLFQEEEYKLRNDPAHVEKVAREKLGFVRPGEVIYKFED